MKLRSELVSHDRRTTGGLSLWALCKDGRELPVDIRLGTLETDQGLMAVVSLRDTSARQKVESDLRSALAEVERLRDRLAAENLYLREETQRAGGYEEFVGTSLALNLVLKQIDQVAVTDANVLIFGETGTGKELVARAIHANSGRKDRPLIIPLLVWHIISQKQAELGKRIEQISTATMDRMAAYTWPGNIRELENVLERAMILSPGSKLLVEPLLDAVEPYLAAEPDQCAPAATSGVIDNVVREHILSVLQQCRWRIKGAGAAAERLGINPSTLRYRMKTLGIRRPV